MSERRWILPLLTVLVALLLPKPAHAWIETTMESDDVRVELDAAGMATVGHEVTLRIRGPQALKQLDIAGIDGDATQVGDANATPMTKDEAGAPVPVTFAMMPDGTLRLGFDEGRGIAKGTFVVRFRYHTDLAKRGMLERDGAMVRVRFLGAKWASGVDSAKATFVFPSAPTEPKPASDRPIDGAEGDLALSGAGAFLSTVKRNPTTDELELVRAHVARGEQVAWTARVDPKAFAGISDPRIKPPPAAAVQSIVRDEPRERPVFLSVSLGVAILFTALMGLKTREVALACERAGVTPRPVIPMPPAVRIVIAGPLVALGVLLQLFLDVPLWGTCALVFAMAVMAHATPKARAVARGPGRWLPLADDDAFPVVPRVTGGYLDASTRAGKITLVATALVLAGVVALTARVSPFHATLAGLDGLVLTALFATGRQGELPGAAATRHARDLQKLALRLRKDAPSLRTVALGRFANGEPDADELRLLVMPRLPVRGLTAIEVGMALSNGPGGAVACPEVLVRVTEESAAAEHLESLVLGASWVKGRKPGERVMVVTPRWPTLRMTASLVRRLAFVLAEARASQTSAARSAGKPLSARKPSTTSSPAKPMEAAWSA